MESKQGGEKKYVCVGESDTLRQELNSMRLNDALVDVTIMVGSQEFAAHRSVLAAKVKFFREKFEANPKRNTVRISDEFEDVFEDILEFIYLNRICLTHQNWNLVLKAAQQLSFDILEKVTKQYVAVQIPSRNFLEIFDHPDANTGENGFEDHFIKPKLLERGTSSLFLIGGKNIKGDVVSTVRKWNPATKKLTEVTSMWTPRFNFKAAVIGTKIYMVGGHSPKEELKKIEVYDTIENKWSDVRSMSIPREGCGVAALDGRLYVCGGQLGEEQFSCLKCYDPLLEKWKTLASMSQKRWNFELVAFCGKLYAIGGAIKTSKNKNEDQNQRKWLKTVERYDPKTDTWIDVASINADHQILGSAVLNNRIKISSRNCFEEYDSENNTWQVVPRMLTSGKLAVVDGRLLVINANVGKDSSIQGLYFDTRNWVDILSEPLKDYAIAVANAE